MLQKEQFDKIRDVLNDFVEDEEVKKIYSHANFTPMQLKALNVLIVEALRYYDTINNGIEVSVR